MKNIGKILLIIDGLSVFVRRRIYLLFLYNSYRKGIIDDFHYQIQRTWVIKRKRFGLWNNFYQTHPKLKFNGVRPTISRINNYKLLEYVDDKSIVLDIGCNTAFFSAYLSNFVQKIDAIEVDEDVLSIAINAIKYLEISNINLVSTDIMKFQSSTKYDLVMSFAVHRWVGISIEKYIELLLSFKNDSGLIIIESHSDDLDKASLSKAISSLNLEILFQGITDDHLGYVRDFYVVK